MSVLDFNTITVGNRVGGVTLCSKAEVKSGDNWRMLVGELTKGNQSVQFVFRNVPKDYKVDLVGNLVTILGEVKMYKDKLQLVLDSISLLKDTSGYDLGEFVPKAPIDIDTYYKFISEITKGIDSEPIKGIVLRALDKVSDKIKTHPAAKSNHHAYLGGLLYHTVTMLQLGQIMCRLKKFLSKDLLYASIILHDLGKCLELDAVNGVVSDYSHEGKLLGHISIVDGWIVEACGELGFDLNSEEVLMLRSSVLSHHGKKEWGSPVEPRTAEALVLHHIDNLDAKTQMAEVALEKIEFGKWTERLFSLDNTQLYKHRL